MSETQPLAGAPRAPLNPSDVGAAPNHALTPEQVSEMTQRPTGMERPAPAEPAALPPDQPTPAEPPAGYFTKAEVEAREKALRESLEAHKQKLLDETKAAKTAAEPWTAIQKELGFDVDTAKKILDTVKHSREAEMIANGDIDGALRERLAAKDNEWQNKFDVEKSNAENLAQENNQLKERLTGLQKRDKLMAAVHDAKLEGQQAETAVMLMDRYFALDDNFESLIARDTDGLELYDPDNSENKMSPAAFIKHRLKKEHGYLWGTPRGAGDSHPGGSASGAAAPTDWNKMTPGQRIAAAKNNPSLAAKHAPQTHKFSAR